MTNEEFIKSVSLEGELWKDVVGYEGKYFISNFGRVATISPKKGFCILNGEIPNKFHLRVDLYKKCKRTRVYVHKLVATHFLENPNDYNEIDHIDGNPKNNHFKNLKWCTHKENMHNPNTIWKYKYKNKGKYNNQNTSKKVVQLKQGEIISIFQSAREAGRIGFTPSCISKCCKNIIQHHKGYEWMYLSDYENLINKSKNS